MDLTSLVLKEDVPTFLYMKDMLDNDLDIFIQGRFASLGGEKHPLALEDYLLIH